MVIGGSSFSPQVLAKRDPEGDVEMSDVSPENVSRCDFSLSQSDTRTDLCAGQKRTRYL